MQKMININLIFFLCITSRGTLGQVVGLNLQDYIYTWPSGETYFGNWTNGKPDGWGTQTWPDGRKYIGMLRNGKQHGQGTKTWPNGEQYVGEWKDGKKNGPGNSTSSDEKYFGEWKDDKKHGQGTEIWQDGRKYFGKWADDKQHGIGTMTWSDGEEYMGVWKDGERNGEGNNTWTSGEKYFGGWKDGKQHGQGTKIWPDGTKYVGEWEDDNQNGQGIKTYASGSKYVGEWKDDKRDGQGNYTWASGTKYSGGWKDGNLHGQGTKTWENGHTYSGEWKDDEKHGHGNYTWEDGNKYSGEWKGDSRRHGNYEWPSGDKYFGGWKNGNLHGKGTKTWVSGETYIGEWKNNEKHGHGNMTWPDGETYSGEWKDDKRDGQGTKIYVSGTIYTGGWKDDEKNGQGNITWSSGNQYSGEWKDGNLHGNGSKIWVSGSKYTGEWKDDEKHGQGNYTYATGNPIGEYSGEFKDDNKHGHGTFLDKYGGKYVGEWKDDKKHRQGNYTLPGEWKDGVENGEKVRIFVSGYADSGEYSGEWQDGEKHGKGNFTWSSGDKYYGEWKDNKKWGQGTFIDRNGDEYTGEWKWNYKHGQGNFTSASGETFAGKWQRHHLISKITTTPAPTTTTTITTAATPGIFASARSSSEYGSEFVPQYSIDGKVTKSSPYFFHSQSENYPWIEVELSVTTNISSVTIMNRLDCCEDRFKNAEIRAGMNRVAEGMTGQLLDINTICGTLEGEGGAEINIFCTKPIMANYITVQLKDHGILHLNEVTINNNENCVRAGCCLAAKRSACNETDDDIDCSCKESWNDDGRSKLEDPKYFCDTGNCAYDCLWCRSGPSITTTPAPKTTTITTVPAYYEYLKVSSKKEAASKQDLLMGTYKLQNSSINNFPHWKQEEGENWLYVQDNGTWAVGQLAGQLGLKNDGGNPAYPYPPNFPYPPFKSGWSYFDDGEWKTDDTFRVDILTENLTCARDGCGQPWAACEDDICSCEESWYNHEVRGEVGRSPVDFSHDKTYLCDSRNGAYDCLWCRPTPPPTTTIITAPFYQLTGDGKIECNETSDCPPAWIDADCDYVRVYTGYKAEDEDFRQDFHCYQRKHEYYCGYTGTCFPYYESEGYATNCYKDPETKITHKSCGECRLELSTKQFLEDQGLPCPSSPAAPQPLILSTATAVQSLLEITDTDDKCPQDTCQRENKCCELALIPNSNIFICPNFC